MAVNVVLDPTNIDDVLRFWYKFESFGPLHLFDRAVVEAFNLPFDVVMLMMLLMMTVTMKMLPGTQGAPPSRSSGRAGVKVAAPESLTGSLLGCGPGAAKSLCSLSR